MAADRFDLAGRNLRIEPRFDRIPALARIIPPTAKHPIAPRPAHRRTDLPRFPALAEDDRQAGDAKDASARPKLAEIAAEVDLRAMSPRDMAAFSYDLYLSGFLSHDLYAELAFQSELMPNFDQTIGALTGEHAKPDKPRDYIAFWNQRLDFESKYYADDDRITRRTKSILELLKSLNRAGAA